MSIKLVRFLLLGSLVSSFLFSCGKSKSDSTQDEVLNDSTVLADSASIDSLRSVDNAPSEDETEALVDSAKEVTPAPVNRTGLHIYISKPTMHQMAMIVSFFRVVLPVVFVREIRLVREIIEHLREIFLFRVCLIVQIGYIVHAMDVL